MSNYSKYLYEFGPFILDTKERCLMRGGDLVHLPPKAFDTLLVLIHNSGHLVEKGELIKKVWPDSFVEEGNLAFNISIIRKGLGDNSANPQYIETVPKRGYRFVAAVTIKQNGNQQPASEPLPAENIELVTSIDLKQENSLGGEIYKRRFLRISLILGTILLLASIAIIQKSWFEGTPRLSNITVLSPSIHRHEFFMRIEGSGFDVNSVQIIVIGSEGCQRVENCVVPNNVLRGVSRTQIESAPLTLDAGDFEIYVRNGSTGRLSNSRPLTVNQIPSSVNISVDGHPHDWVGIPPLLTNPVGDGPFNPYGQYYIGEDFTNISVTHDSTNLYFLLEFAGDYSGGIKIFLDTDLDAGTGCNGAEYIIFVSAAVPGAGLALADGRNCTFKDDFPGAVISEKRGRFVEAAVKIDKLRTITPKTIGVRVSAQAIAPGKGAPDTVDPPVTYLFK
jgi:DNA-binding winged helix-turn-helix (wHTH) protein